MAALSAVVSGNTAWSKIAKATTSANPATQEAFRALKIYLANQKLNPPLNVAFFSKADTEVATGTALGSGAPTIYAVYAKKGTVATSSFLHITDSETSGSITGGIVVAMAFTGAGDEKFWINPNGLLLTTGISVQMATVMVGITSSAAGAGADGFVVYSI